MGVAKAGSLLCIDHGSYSDYDVTGFFVVLRDFSPMLVLDEFKCVNERARSGRFDRDVFLAFLLEKGFLLELSYSTLYLGDYSNIDNVAFYGMTDVSQV